MSDKKKKSNKVQEDQFTPRLPNLYKKRCQANGITVSKVIKEKLDNAIQMGKLETLQLWEQLGSIQIRSLMQALIDVQYPFLKKIRVWKIDLEDEGVRAICNYIEKVNSIEFLDLMDNKITVLGCEFLGKIFAKPNCKIVKFRIDNNPIGDNGLKLLTAGLQIHSKIEKLSLNYCNITQNGVKYIQQIMANIDGQLRTLKLQGNPLKNEGTFQVLRAVKNCGQSLQKLNLCDVELNILNHKMDIGHSIQQKIAIEICEILQSNMNIAKYNFRNNWITDEVAKLMLDTVKQNKNIFIIDMPECIGQGLKEFQNEIMKKRKPKKKKGKGKKGAKKGGKK